MPTAQSPTHDLVEPLVRQLYGLGQVRREIARHAQLELESQGFAALAQLYLHGPLRVSDVAANLAVDLSVASRQIAALVRAGYVSRERDEADGRAQRLRLTDAGQRVLSASHGRMVDAFGAAVAGWTATDVAQLTDLLDRLRGDFAALHTPEETLAA